MFTKKGFDVLSFEQLEEWFDLFRQFGYIPGFVLIYFRAIIPILPLSFMSF